MDRLTRLSLVAAALLPDITAAQRRNDAYQGSEPDMTSVTEAVRIAMQLEGEVVRQARIQLRKDEFLPNRGGD